MKASVLAINGISASAVASGIKKNNNLDLVLINFAKEANTAAVFTQNVFCAAPVMVAKNHLANNVRALIINSGCANAGTGKQGLESAYQSCVLTAQALDIKPEQVLPFSTGTIAAELSIEAIDKALPHLVNTLAENTLDKAAQAIKTTDLVDKTAQRSFTHNGEQITIGGICKGSGMIRPDMATMLAFIFTDLSADKTQLQSALSQAVNQSFNRITVDGDTSTNDCCTLTASAKSSLLFSTVKDKFQTALNEVCLDLALQIVKDGEGATKLLAIIVKGGNTADDCLEVAYTVAHSPLVKTALFASDANWGRILAAVGRSKISQLLIDEVDIYLNDVCLIKGGEPDVDYTEDKGAAAMAGKEISYTIIIGNSRFEECVWTCDLSYDYVKINAEYRT